MLLKKLLEIARIDHSEQLFPLELLLKMCSYSSGNRRNITKMCGFEKKYVVLMYDLIFQLCFFSSFFFSTPITFTNFLAHLSTHFFRFFALYGSKLCFCMRSWDNIFCFSYKNTISCHIRQNNRKSGSIRWFESKKKNSKKHNWKISSYIKTTYFSQIRTFSQYFFDFLTSRCVDFKNIRL